MSETISVRVDKKLKDLFLELVRSEGVDVSQAVRDLISEAVARGYIIKERKELRKKVMEGGRAWQ